MERIPAYEGKNSYMFVSYSHKDTGKVLPAIKKLFDLKYRVWYDEGIVPGSEWPHNIEIHLKNSSTALLYISENSLASPYCENEVINAVNNKKRIIQYSLDGSIHPLLKEYKVIRSDEELLDEVTSDLIGDGSGYDNELNNKHHFSIWNLLLGLALILIVALIGGIYGINKGYFDEYLPGRRTIEEINTETNPVPGGVEVNNDTLAQAILTQLGQEELFKEIEFESEEDKIAIHDAIGIPHDEKLTYYDLTNTHLEDLHLYNCSDKCLELLKYLPQLEVLRINSDRITSLESLKDCAYLNKVYLHYNCFPLDLPEEHRYEICFFN